MRALILHDAIDANARPDETDALVQADLIRRCLETDGHSVDQYGVTLDLRPAAARIEQADLVFNIVESLAGRGSLIHIIPSLVESLRVPMTGCPAHAIAQTSNKLTAKRIMRAADLPTPAWLSADDGQFTPGRWIIKSVWEHASVGLDDTAIVEAHDESMLRALIASRRDQLGGLAFAEQFIDGREFNISIIEHDRQPLVLPHAEIVFQGFAAHQARIVSYAAKWNAESFEYNNTPRTFDFAPADAPLLRTLTHLAQQCWRAFGLRGYARVDFRVDPSGRPWILEVNTNPCLSEDAGFMAATTRAALQPGDVIGRIVQAALRDAAAVP